MIIANAKATEMDVVELNQIFANQPDLALVYCQPHHYWYWYLMCPQKWIDHLTSEYGQIEPAKKMLNGAATFDYQWDDAIRERFPDDVRRLKNKFKPLLQDSDLNYKALSYTISGDPIEAIRRVVKYLNNRPSCMVGVPVPSLWTEWIVWTEDCRYDWVATIKKKGELFVAKYFDQYNWFDDMIRYGHFEDKLAAATIYGWHRRLRQQKK